MVQDSHQSSPLETAAKSFERLYDKVRHLQHFHKYDEVQTMLSENFRVPDERGDSVDSLYIKLASPPNNILKSTQPLMSLAKYYGSITGNFVKQAHQQNLKFTLVLYDKDWMP
jgi:hypothetical protein